LNVFLDGEVSPGEKDKQLYLRLRDAHISKDWFPHLARWKGFMDKLMKA